MEGLERGLVLAKQVLSQLSYTPTKISAHSKTLSRAVHTDPSETFFDIAGISTCATVPDPLSLCQMLSFDHPLMLVRQQGPQIE